MECTRSWVQGRADEAFPLYERAQALRENVHGTSHPDYATSLNNFAALLYTKGRCAAWTLSEDIKVDIHSTFISGTFLRYDDIKDGEREDEGDQPIKQKFRE